MFQYYSKGKIGPESKQLREMITLSDYTEKLINDLSLSNCDQSLIVDSGTSAYKYEILPHTSTDGNFHGGTSFIFKTANRGIYAKLISKEFRYKYLENKIRFMVENNPHLEGLAWPLDTLYYEGKFIGFTMQKFEGERLDLLSFPYEVKLLCKKYNKHFGREEQLIVINNILHKFKQIHEANLLVADVKLENILIDFKTFNVYMVDVDSFQVDRFISEFSSPGYDAPEIVDSYKGKDWLEKRGTTFPFKQYYSTYYRSFDQEYHAIAVLIYRLLLVGCFPYAQEDFGCCSQGNIVFEDVVRCRNREFPYSVDENNKLNTCRYEALWSHFPFFLKNSFVQTFTCQKRLNVNEWIKVTERYQKLLKNKDYLLKDSEAMNAYPEEIISYNDVFVYLNPVVYETRFSMDAAVIGLIKKLEDESLLEYTEIISDKLKQYPEIRLKDYLFKVVYNMGVLKKIEGRPLS